MGWILFWERAFPGLRVVPQLRSRGYLFREIWTPFRAGKIPLQPRETLPTHVSRSQECT